MVDVLVQRWLHPQMETGVAMARAGGLWMPAADAAPADVVAAVRERGIRALEVHGDAAFVRELPELEYLVVLDPPDVGPIHELPRLRLLAFSGGWTGTLDGGAWPHLEWFTAGEIPKDGGGVASLAGHPHLHDLGLGRFPDSDLTRVTAPRLRALAVSESRKITRLTGIERHAERLTALTLSGMANLETVDELRGMSALEVVHLDRLRHITGLAALAALPALRFLDITELKNVESLAPLAGHPTLEYLAFGRTEDLDLEPLLEVPRLKVVHCDPRIRWNRDLHELTTLADLEAGDPRLDAWRELAVR